MQTTFSSLPKSPVHRSIVGCIAGLLLSVPLSLTGCDNATGVDPSIVVQPQSQTITVGETATFKVETEGAAPFTYQWYKGGVPIPNSSGYSYTTPVATLSDNNEAFTVSITNPLASTISVPAVLTVQPMGTISGSRP